MADNWGTTSGDWGNVQQLGQNLYGNIGNQANTLMSSVVANNPWSSGSSWGQYPDIRNADTRSHLNTFMDYTMSGQRNQMDEYVRRAANAGITRGGQNVQGGPAFQASLNQQALSNLAAGYETRFDKAMEYLANNYAAQNKAWTDAAQIASQLYGVQQQGLNTLAGDIASARNYAAAMAGQGSAERIAGIEQQTALGTAGIQKEWQQYAAQKQLEAAIQQAEASKYGAELGLQGTQAQTAAARYAAELEKAWQETASQKQYEAAARQAQASEFGASQAAGAQKYGAELTSGATRYASDQERLAQIQAALYGKEAQLGVAGLQSEWEKYAAAQQLAAATRQAQASEFGASQAAGAQKYGAEQQKAAQLGVAGLQSEWEKYAAEQQLAAATRQAQASEFGAKTAAEAQKYGAELQSEWQKYGAEQQKAAQLGAAGLQSEWQKYAAEQQLAGIQKQVAGQTSLATLQDKWERYKAEQAYKAQVEAAAAAAAAQKYAVEQNLEGTKYAADKQVRAASESGAYNKKIAAMQAYANALASWYAAGGNHGQPLSTTFHDW